MATVYTPEKYADVIDRLAIKIVKATGRPIFKTQMHLLVFAALIGYDRGERTSSKSRRKGSEIYEEIFDRNGMDGVAFLMALQEAKDGDILRDKNDVECWKVIEDYAESGFKALQELMLNSPGDTDGVETILAEMKKRAATQLRSDPQDNPDEIDVQF